VAAGVGPGSHRDRSTHHRPADCQRSDLKLEAKVDAGGNGDVLSLECEIDDE
jgi:hypothetical protein